MITCALTWYREYKASNPRIFAPDNIRVNHNHAAYDVAVQARDLPIYVVAYAEFSILSARGQAVSGKPRTPDFAKNCGIRRAITPDQRPRRAITSVPIRDSQRKNIEPGAPSRMRECPTAIRRGAKLDWLISRIDRR